MSVVLAFVMLVPAGAAASPPVDQYVEDIPTTEGEKPVGSPEATPTDSTDAGSAGAPAPPAAPAPDAAPATGSGDDRAGALPDRIEIAETDAKGRSMRGAGGSGVPLALIRSDDEGPGFLGALGSAFGLGGMTLAALALAALIGAALVARRGSPRGGGPE
jgi:hypothetical protein